MSREMYETHPEFLSACEFWRQAGAPPLSFADWFKDRELEAEYVAWRWAAEGYDGTGNMAVGTSADGRHFSFTPTANGTATRRATFAEAVIDVLEFWSNGGGLSEEQLNAARRVLTLAGEQPIATIGGYAGTGKSRVLSHLYHARPTWATIAYTGKAADTLRRLGLPGNTIHGTIYRPVYERGRRVRWQLLTKAELRGVGGFLIDEASMVPRPQLDELLSFGKPIVAVGDHGQLPPVGEDAGLMREPDVTLETVHRNAGPIARFAEFLRHGGDPRDWGEKGMVVAVVDRCPEGSLLKADQIICAFNRTRVKLNAHIRHAFGRGGVGGIGPPEVGDRVMCLRNNYNAGLFNGQQGVALVVDAGTNTIVFRPDGSVHPGHSGAIEVRYIPEAFNRKKPERDAQPDRAGRVPFDYANAITCHKAISDEWGKVVVYDEPAGADLWERKRWRYTAASRAKDALIWVIRD